MGGSAAVSLLLVLGACLNAGTAVDTTIIVLTVAQSDFATSNTSSPSNFTGEESSGYFPLSNALESVMRLAADDINTGASSLGPTEGDLTLKVIGVKSGIQAMEGFCTALEAVGENGTFGVRTKTFYFVLVPGQVILRTYRIVLDSCRLIPLYFSLFSFQVQFHREFVCHTRSIPSVPLCSTVQRTVCSVHLSAVCC